MRRATFPVFLLTIALSAGTAQAVAQPPAEPGSSDPDLGVLFIGAHPDDEASMLSTFGQWRQDHGARTGVVTITRGEGGGNAVGPEEGPELGLLREGEERRAVGKAGITDVYNLDEADLYYTVSAPLTERAWGHDDVLSKLVRVVRQTRPEVVVTMDPAPTPGNHGNHQYAARLALEAYRLAGDPAAFPEQITREGLAPWSVRRVLGSGSRDREVLGPECERLTGPPGEPGRWYEVWGGRRTPDGATWEQREREAQREYVSQGWADWPDEPDDPARIGCDHMTELANRAPHAPNGSGPGAALYGALLPEPRTLPVGTGVEVVAERSRVVPGVPVPVRVTVSAPKGRALPPGELTVAAPPGWGVQGDGRYPALPPDGSSEVDFTVTPSRTHAGQRVTLPVRIDSPAGAGVVWLRMDPVGPVVAEQAPLPGVGEFQNWARTTGFPLLADAVPPVRTIPVGQARDVEVLVRNNDRTPRTGTVRIDPPRGFAVRDPEQPFRDLAPGATTSVTFRVRNTDPTMPTGMRGGDHRYTLTTDSGITTSREAALELVPATSIPGTREAPVVDGRAGPGEYPRPALDLSSRWEGTPCESRTDCSATAKLSWHADRLHAVVDVTDDRAGSVLAPNDCKRHWRTDAVELAIDPKGTSENTSSTFKLGVLPRTDNPAAGNPPCFARDADNFQGPGRITAPGVRVAATNRPDGYTLELSIPARALPGTIDPRRMGLNLLVYDSDTRDRVGQTRIGWSTWEGVQGDPYRWGVASVPGWPSEDPSPAPPPRLPLDALDSVDSPASIAQAVRLGTSLGAAPAAGAAGARVTAAEAGNGAVRARVTANGPGRAHAFVLDEKGDVLGDTVIDLSGAEDRWVSIEVPQGSPHVVLLGFRAPNGATEASSRAVP